MATTKFSWLAGVAIASLATACFALDAKKPGRSVSALEANQAVRIVFHSKGCFNDQSYTLKLNGETLDKVLISGPDRKGTAPITDKERKDLDKTLEFYRSKPGGECTTTDSITVYWTKYGVPVLRESFEDSTCSQQLLGTLVRKAVAGPSMSQGKVEPSK